MKPSSAATSRYHKKVYEQIYLFVKKGEKEKREKNKTPAILDISVG